MAPKMSVPTNADPPKAAKIRKTHFGYVFDVSLSRRQFSPESPPLEADVARLIDLGKRFDGRWL